ncbi:MAG: glycosyltransferase [Flavobacteriaceae bacterium]|jgi:glycosyltransferase involved in cell wall biosynthesis|nr:glycosyltransferase [Pelagibacteraceae bacterium]MBT6170107.1 glycosyltransferase [Flavobacteriaceae bacterium]
MSKLVSVCHITSVHNRYDIRIFIKQCTSLQKSKKFNTHLIVSDGKKNEIKNHVQILDVGIAKNRFERMFKISQKIYLEALRLDSHIYHIHDPELIPLGIKLKKIGKKVIFDAHEDIAEDILTKSWIPFILRKITSIFFGFYGSYALKKFDFIITATSFIRDKYIKINSNTLDINNYPILEEFNNINSWSNRNDIAVYIGVISRRRGIIEIIESYSNLSKFHFVIAGQFENSKIEKEVVENKNWHNIEYKGFVGRRKIIEMLNTSKVGFQIVESLNSYQDAIPIKMLEYMAAGIPVICSNMNILSKIINDNKCGIILKETNKEEIRKSLDYLLKNPNIAKEMGKNGRQKILKDWNWECEASKLLNLYDNLNYENNSNY